MYIPKTMGFAWKLLFEKADKLNRFGYSSCGPHKTNRVTTGPKPTNHRAFLFHGHGELLKNFGLSCSNWAVQFHAIFHQPNSMETSSHFLDPKFSPSHIDNSYKKIRGTIMASILITSGGVIMADMAARATMASLLRVLKK